MMMGDSAIDSHYRWPFSGRHHYEPCAVASICLALTITRAADYKCHRGGAALGACSTPPGVTSWLHRHSLLPPAGLRQYFNDSERICQANAPIAISGGCIMSHAICFRRWRGGKMKTLALGEDAGASKSGLLAAERHRQVLIAADAMAAMIEVEMHDVILRGAAMPAIGRLFRPPDERARRPTQRIGLAEAAAAETRMGHKEIAQPCVSKERSVAPVARHVPDDMRFATSRRFRAQLLITSFHNFISNKFT